MFHPSEIELGETIKAILGEVERIDPARVVFDSLSELRLLPATRCATADRCWR
jgi:circadian clock protein KaiC